MSSYTGKTAWLIWMDLKSSHRNFLTMGITSVFNEDYYNVLTLYVDLYPKMIEQSRSDSYGPHV